MPATSSLRPRRWWRGDIAGYNPSSFGPLSLVDRIRFEICISPPGGWVRACLSHDRHATHPAIVKRLKRAEGHLRSIVEMIEGGRSCSVARSMSSRKSRNISDRVRVHEREVLSLHGGDRVHRCVRSCHHSDPLAVLAVRAGAILARVRMARRAAGRERMAPVFWVPGEKLRPLP